MPRISVEMLHFSPIFGPKIPGLMLVPWMEEILHQLVVYHLTIQYLQRFYQRGDQLVQDFLYPRRINGLEDGKKTRFPVDSPRQPIH